MNLQTVHIRVNDAATGQPTPVRLRVTDAAGNYYAPFGHAREFPVGRGEAVGGDVTICGERWAYIDGTCEIALPPGELTVAVRKGPEYRPLQQAVNLPAGKLSLRFVIERETDLRAAGWFAGDTRAHAVSPHAALLEAAAEDLAVVHLLVRETPVLADDGQSYSTYPNLTAFCAQQACLERDGTAVCVGTLNAHPVLGKLALLQSHRVVYPLTFGGPDATDDWSLADWCGQCHRKRGLAIWADAFDPKTGHAGEALADVILAEIDALELNLGSSHCLRGWYHLLNAGVRVPVVGASAKNSNRTPLGEPRTYARLDAGQPFRLADWIEAVRAGRTIVTGGPFLRLEVNGQGLGGVVRCPADTPQVRVRFGVGDPTLVERVTLVANGEVLSEPRPSGSAGSVQLPDGCGFDEVAIDLPDGGWVAARALVGGRLIAHTSPVYVEVEGLAPFVDAAAMRFLDWHLRRAREWIEGEASFALPKSRDHLLAIFDQAWQKLLARAGGSDTIAT
jgi:hypothetical protein